MKTFLSAVEDNVRVYDPEWIISNGVFLRSYRGEKNSVYIRIIVMSTWRWHLMVIFSLNF